MTPPTVFFLHYLGGSRRTWEPVIRLLGESVSSVAIDLPGFGDAARTPGYDVARMVQAVSQAIRARNAQRWILVGHSMGAKVATGVARSSEDGEPGLGGLEGLVLVAGSPPAPEPMERKKRETMLSWFHGDKASSRVEAERYVSENAAQPLTADVVEGAVLDVLRANRAAWVAWLESGSREDWTDRVALLRSPTLVLAGEEDDALGPTAQTQWMLPHLKQSILVTLPRAGHLLPLELPHELAPRILAHARSIAADCLIPDAARYTI